MISLSLNEIRDLTGGRVEGTNAPASVVVDGPVTNNSRECGPGSLYVARAGEHADGHDFAAAAVTLGAVAALTSRPVDGVPCVVVDDVKTAFGRVARGVADRAPALRVVGVTGSSGKTSVKDVLASVLSSVAETVAPVNSLNSEMGVPLTVCRVTPSTRFLVAEMGARGIGHIDYLTRIVPPQVAIVLNVGSAHLGEFGSRENIARAKSELPRAVPAEGLSILNADDPVVAAMRRGLVSRVQLVGLSPRGGGPRGRRFVQGAETANVHPGLRIQDHEQVPFGLVCLAADEPKGDPPLGRKKTQRAETDLNVRSYGERHMRLVRGHLNSVFRSTRSPPGSMPPRLAAGGGWRSLTALMDSRSLTTPTTPTPNRCAPPSTPSPRSARRASGGPSSAGCSSSAPTATPTTHPDRPVRAAARGLMEG